MIIYNDTPRCQKWVSDNFNVSGNDLLVCIGHESNGILKSVVGYNHYNGKSCHIHAYSKEVHLAKEFVSYAFAYPFLQLNVDLLIVIQPTSNIKSCKLADKAGFIEHSLITDADPDGDLRIAILKKQDCKYLRSNKNAIVKTASAA